jgi:predicted dehydrogenase
MGQVYAQAFSTYPDTEIVAIAEHNAERRQTVGERFGVRALYPDAEQLLQEVVPDVASVVTPVKYIKEAVVACAEAGVKGVTAEKPIAGVLSDADEMVKACAERGIVFGGGNLQRAMPEVQEAARRIRAGEFGDLAGAAVHGFGGEISGGGCQHISVLRLFTDAEVEEVVAWGTPEEALAAETDEGLIVHGRFQMTSGLSCAVFGTPTPLRGVDVWSQDALIRWDWAPPEIFRGFDEGGRRVRIDPEYAPYEWHEFGYLTGALRSFLAAVQGEGEPWVTGHDLRQALEVAIAAKLSAQRDSSPVKLPLEDRSWALLPRAYRWVGGDQSGMVQSVEEAAGRAAKE